MRTPDLHIRLKGADGGQAADTCATIHLWTQVFGKIRLALAFWRAKCKSFRNLQLPALSSPASGGQLGDKGIALSLLGRQHAGNRRQSIPRL
jgi:hypothetical protein